MNARLLLAAAFSLTTTLSVNASETRDTVVVEQPEQVTIRNQRNGYEVEIKGMKNNPTYHYQYQRTFESEDSLEIIKEDGKEDGMAFNVPFSRYRKERKSKRYSFSPHWSGIGIGFNTVVGTAQGGLNGPDGVSVNMGKSIELAFNLPMVTARIEKGWGLFTGLGMTWRNYRMDNDRRFVQEDNTTRLEAYPEHAKIQFSRLKVFSITMPFMCEWQASSDESWFVNAGVQLNFNTHATYKTRYKLDGKDISETIKDIHQVPVTVDFMVQFGYNSLGIYAKYSPCRLVKEAYGPVMTPLTIGMALYF